MSPHHDHAHHEHATHHAHARRPAEILDAEHDVIKALLVAMDGMARRIETGRVVPATDMGDAVDTLAGFADQCHHAKEEKILFPALQRTGTPEAERIVRELEGDHKAGRKLVGMMRDAAKAQARGEASAAPDFARAAKLYRTLLTRHIEIKSDRLLPLVERSFPAEEQERLGEAFEKVEEEEMGAGAHERFEGIVHRLAEAYAG